MKKTLWLKQKQVSKAVWEDEPEDDIPFFEELAEILVTDAPMQAEFTGILDSQGNKIYSMPYKNPIGFDLS